MKPILANLDRHPDGVLTGVLRTLSIRCQIEIRPRDHDAGVTHYLMIASPDFLLGQGEQHGDPCVASILFHLRAPELANELIARAEAADGDRWILYWLAQ